ncbi:hypothetical protein [Teichococcus vastitatis]|uniref:Molecular chaperone DnaJ n=1 Tax=Teichococcus vastitatis TaxID=2307076 RepID=A0ABS9WB35_9PROT|nr:hypothetical protein [Pseudoroseomonas vastitatis]MCI0756509.1 hypothetical protein [Pseudoroseomonas vastitatis]
MTQGPSNESGASGTAASPAEQVNPGDDAAPGTAGTGEDVCPDCQGSGKIDDQDCQNCGGTGIVIQGLAGG